MRPFRSCLSVFLALFLMSVVPLVALAQNSAVIEPESGAGITEKTAVRKIIVKVDELPDPKDTAVTARADRAVVEAFLKKFPNIDLRPYSGFNIQGMNMDSKPLLAIAGGVSADVLYVNFRLSHTYISQGFLYPLDEYVQQMSDGEWNERVPVVARKVITRKGTDGAEHIWAIPYSTMVRALAYRKDLFVEVGLDPDKPPRNWDELEKYAKRLTRPDKGTYGLVFAQSWLGWDWIGFLWTLGGEAVEQDVNGEWRAAFDSEAAVESLRYFARLCAFPWRDSSGNKQNGYVCTDMYPLSKQKWDEGKIGMSLQYLDERQIGRDIDPNLVGIAPVPLGPNGKRASELNCAMVGLFAGIEGRDGFTAKEIRDAAWEWIRFMDSDEARRIRTKVFVEAGNGRLYNPLYLKKYGYDEYLDLVPKGWIETYEETINNGKAEPYGKNCQTIYRYMNRPVEEVIKLAKRDDWWNKSEEEQRRIVQGILTQHVGLTNEKMIGTITPRERQKRNNIALVVGVFMFSGFLIVLYRVWKIFTPEEAVRTGGWGFRRYRMAYLIMLPTVLSILLWKYAPMVMGSAMVFEDYRLVGSSVYTGMSNLADVLWDVEWWKSMLRTLYYMFLLLGLGFGIPIILAILLTEVSHCKVVYRTLYYLPAVLSGMVVIYLWKLMYDKSEIGTLNQLLGLFGVRSVDWLGTESLAMLCCVIPTIWAGAGPKCLLYLAALKTVPDDLYEAADLDNCGFMQKITHITLPTLKGLIIINFISEFIAAAENTHFILVMTFGGPRDATKVAGLAIFETAYLNLRFGPATTMAWTLGITLLGFTTLQLRRLSRMEFTAAAGREAAKS